MVLFRSHDRVAMSVAYGDFWNKDILSMFYYIFPENKIFGKSSCPPKEGGLFSWDDTPGGAV